MKETDNTDKFDLEVKSMLQDADEEVPAGAWEGISASLDKRQGAVLLRRWVLGSCAAAAAVAIAFVAGRGTHSGQTSQSIAQAASVQNIEQPVQSIEDNVLVAQESPAKKPTVPSKAAVKTETEVETEIVTEEENGSISVTGIGTEKKTEKETTTETYSEMSFEDEADNKPAGRLDIAVGGNVSNNDGNISGGNVRLGVQSGAVQTPTTTGIQENSNSIYGLPLSFGLGVRYWFNSHIGIGTGLQYSLLTRSFNGTYTQVADDGTVEKSVTSDISHRAQYIGIPVNVYYNVISTDRLRFYVYAGGAGEKCISNSYRIYSEPDNITYRTNVRGLQWSVGTGIGAEYIITDHWSLYIDPSARYYFDCGQPRTVRSDKKYMLEFEAGVRFNL